MRVPSPLVLACFGLLGIAAPARASLLGATVDVRFDNGSSDTDLGNLVIGAVPVQSDDAYGLVTLSASEITIGPPSYVTSKFTYPTSAFTGFLFEYGTGATVTGASVDPSSSISPTGLLKFFPTLGVNLSGEALSVGQSVVIDVSGSYAGTPASVPEPAGIALFAPALAGLVLRRRRAAGERR